MNKVDIKPVSEILPFLYASDVRFIGTEIASKTIKNVKQLFPKITDKQEINRLEQVLLLDIIVKLCAYAEDLAAASTSILKGGDFGQNLIKYETEEIHEFYRNLDSRGPLYFSKILGYPSFSLQRKKEQLVLEKSCEIIKEDMIKVKNFFFNYWNLYNAYKHGFRLLLGISKYSDPKLVEIEGYGFFYFKRRPNQLKFKILQKGIVKEFRYLSGVIRRLIEVIIKNYHGTLIARSKRDWSSIRLNIFRRREAKLPKGLRFVYPKLRT